MVTRRRKRKVTAKRKNARRKYAITLHKVRKNRNANTGRKRTKTGRWIVAKKRRAKVSRRRKVVSGKHRPTIIVRKGRMYRPKRSRFFKGPTRINPRRRRRSGFRRNPFNVKTLLNKQWLMTMATFSAGIIGGVFTLGLMNRFMSSENNVKFGRFYGAANILMAGLLAGFVKGARAKEAAVALGATGVYDLVQQNVSQLALPDIRGYNLVTMALGAPAASSSSAAIAEKTDGMGMSYERGMGMSYVPSTMAGDDTLNEVYGQILA